MIVVTRTRRVDWARVIANLRSLGMSWADIASGVGVSRSVLQDYADDRCN